MVSVFVNAETEYFLKFTKADESSIFFSTEGLKLMFDEANITVYTNNSTSILPIAQMRKMQFTTEPEVSIPIEDVNGDGEVNIADINAVINMILSGSINTMGDVNRDGEVNIADINAIINRILGSPL